MRRVPSLIGVLSLCVKTDRFVEFMVESVGLALDLLVEWVGALSLKLETG